MAKQLVWRSLRKFMKKAKEVKNDPIQDKLLDIEGVIIDSDGKFVVVEEGAADFIDVSSLQVASLQMRSNRGGIKNDLFGEALNCK